MSIEQFKNINEVISTKEVYLGQDIDKKTYDLINNGYIRVDFPTTNFPNPTINPVLMEFVLYDANNQILEQKDYGIVRYIAATEFDKYLIQSSNIGDAIQNNNGYLADIKTLIREAGFTTGYFRVQINFVRDRVGSHNQYEKVFVQEISPSRQEIRLLPYSNVSTDAGILSKLNQQYQTFADGKFEWDSTLVDINNLSDRIKSTDANEIVNAPALTTPEGEFLVELQKEFGSSAASIIQATISKILSIDPIADPDTPYWYSKQDVIDAWIRAFKTQLENVLPKRNIVNSAVYNSITAASLDALTNTVQTLQSDVTYGLPQVQRTILDPNPPIITPPLVAPTIPVTADNTLIDPGIITTTPSLYNYELTDCSDSTIKIAAISTTPKYGAYATIYNGKCYSITSAVISTTFAYLATGINLDTLSTYNGCGSCIAALIGNPPTGTTLAFVVNPYSVLTTQDSITVTWATNAPTIGTVGAYYGTSQPGFTPGLSSTPLATANVTIFSTADSVAVGGLSADFFYDIDVSLTGQDGQTVSATIFSVKTQPAGPTIPNSGVTTTDYYVLADCDYPNFIIYGYSTGQYQIADVLNIGGVCYTITAVQALDVAALGINPINLDPYYSSVYTACLPCKTALGGGTTTAGGGTTTTNNITVNSGAVTSPTTITTTTPNTQTTAGQTIINGITYDSSGAIISIGNTTTMN